VPARAKLKKLKEVLSNKGISVGDEDLLALAVGWIDSMLQDFAFDATIDKGYRYKAAGYYKPAWGSKGQFDKALREALTSRWGLGYVHL